MAPHASLLTGVKAEQLLEAIRYVAKEDPNMKIKDLEAILSEAAQPPPRICDRRPQVREILDSLGDGNDGDDEFEEEEKGAHAPLLPPLSFTDPTSPPALPFRFKVSPPKTSPNITSPSPQPLVKTSDGIRDELTTPHSNSLYGGALLPDIQASIHAAIPSHAAIQKARLKQRTHTRATSKPHPPPQTPPRRGTPRPWPTTPTPLFTPRLTTSHTTCSATPSPTRSRSRLRKHRALFSAPTTSTPASESPERGRPRARKGDRSPALRGISAPRLQHPILVPGWYVGVGAPSPLARSRSAVDGVGVEDVRGAGVGGVVEMGGEEE